MEREKRNYGRKNKKEMQTIIRRKERQNDRYLQRHIMKIKENICSDIGQDRFSGHRINVGHTNSRQMEGNECYTFHISTFKFLANISDFALEKKKIKKGVGY